MPQLYSNLSGKSKVLLPDGSEVWMHTETSLQYESQMNKDERIVNVTGEAYFDEMCIRDSMVPARNRNSYGMERQTHFPLF